MTNKENQLADVGAALEESLDLAWGWWRKQYAPSLSNELAWTEKVHILTVDTKILKGGRVRITIYVQAQKPWQSDSYPFEYRRQGNVLSRHF